MSDNLTSNELGSVELLGKELPVKTRSLLRYPGGKSKAVAEFKKTSAEKPEEAVFPFFWRW